VRSGPTGVKWEIGPEIPTGPNTGHLVD